MLRIEREGDVLIVLLIVVIIWIAAKIRNQ